MALKRSAIAAGMCVLAASADVTQAQKAATEAGVRAAPSAAARDEAWSITLKSNKGAPKDKLWSQQEIDQALARCVVMLDDLDVVAEAESPLREGSICGTPAPMRLISIGRGTEKVSFTPAPIVTCELIAGLAQWLRQDVQKLARRHLGAPVVRIDTMSSYSCRNAYGRSSGRMSEHGRANALDLGAFHTDKDQVVSVEANWGITQREIAAARLKEVPNGNDDESVAVNGEPTKTVTVRTPRAAPAKPAEAPGEAQSASIVPVPTPAPRSLLDLRPSLPAIMVFPPGISVSNGLGFDQSSRLGGPKPPATTTATLPRVLQPVTNVAANKLQFLRAVHKAGCRVFNTVLGPEANKTHRNHFHVDMAARVQNTKVCE